MDKNIRLTAVLDTNQDIEVGFFQSRERAYEEATRILNARVLIKEDVVYPATRISKFLVGL
jgi:hypothetical protein